MCCAVLVCVCVCWCVFVLVCGCSCDVSDGCVASCCHSATALGPPLLVGAAYAGLGSVSDNIADSSVDFWHYAQTTNIQIFLSLSLIFLFLCFSCFHFDFLSCKKPSKSLAWSFVKAHCRFSGRFMVLLNPNYHCFCCCNCCCCCW